MTLQDAYYELRFQNEFFRAKGNAFQSLFERLMGLAYKADFMACRPWGKQGDHKNDGFLKSERRLFQVYAPNELEATRLIAKITEDFEGAKQHWKSYFDSWVFVHNGTDGLPPHVQKLLLDFELSNPGIVLQPWGLDELLVIFRKLTLDDKESWFGPALSDGTKACLGFADLEVVLERIAGLPVPPMSNVRDVPAGKIEANALSDSVARLLKEGMIKSSLVEDFLSHWHDETLGDKLAEAFKTEYSRLRRTMSPDQVFTELESWAGGNVRGTPEHELAVLTVMAYYFERCDIFEEPRSVPR
jgi:hypothetical protein